MTTTFTIHGYVLEAMLSFAAEERSYVGEQSVLSGVLCEVTPESLRLVATETHVLGCLHITQMNAFELDIQCAEPVQLVLPVHEFKALLRDRRYPSITVTIDDDLNVTVSNSAGLTMTVMGRPVTDYPAYARVIPTSAASALVGIAVDAALLGRFHQFAKLLREEPKLTLGFHNDLGPISVRLKNVSAFYGILMPMMIEEPAAVPAWLVAPAEEEQLDVADAVMTTEDADERMPIPA